MKDDLSPEVLIVGGGPVGLTTGINLRRYGVPCRVIEQRTGPSDTSRGLMLTPASLHVYDRLGVAQTLCEHAYHVAHANLYWQGRRMYRLPFGAMPTPFNFLLMRPQPETERILLDRYLALGGCYEAGVELRTLRAEANGVEVELQGPSGTSTRRYAHLVGADGSRSTVRRALDIPTVQEKPDFMRFVLGDFKVSWPSGHLEETHYFVSDEGFMIVLPLKPGYHRVFFKGPGVHTQIVLDAHWFRAMAGALAPSDFVLSDPIWISSVPHHAKVAQQFRQGRAYLVGDAAHSFSPMGGQGMNTGIQDAFNLSWKLALRCHGLGSERLLDSFHAERHGAATAVTANVMSNTRLICREDCDPQGSLKSFLPRRQNVKFLRHLLPRLMSGLATAHSQGAFVAGPGARWAGKMAEPSTLADRFRGLYSDIWFTLLVFNRTQLGYPGVKALNALASAAACPIEIRLLGQDESCLTTTPSVRWMGSLGEAVMNAFDVPDGTLLLVRPDLYVGCECSASALGPLRQFLAQYLVAPVSPLVTLAEASADVGWQHAPLIPQH